MKYFKSIILYYFKNFWFLMLFSIIPAVFVGLLLKPFQFVQFLYAYPSLTLGNFADFFYGILPFDWLTLLLGFIGLVLTAVIISMLLGKIEKNFRIGKNSYSLKETGFNNNFSSVLIGIFCVAFCYFVIALLGVVLIMLFNFIFASINAVVVSVILSYMVCMLCFWLTSAITIHFGVVASDMMITGSTFATAMSNASQAIHKNTWQNLLIGFVPFLIAILLTLLGCWLGILWLTNIISMLIIIPYTCVLVMIIFFDYYGLTRYDTRPYYNLK